MKTLIVLVFVSLFAPWCSAQVPAGLFGTILTYDGKPIPERIAVLDAKGKPVFLTAGTASRGEAFPLLRASNPLVFLRERRNPAPGEPLVEPAGAIAWPTETKERVVFLVAVTLSRDGLLNVRGLAANDDLSEFPANTARFVNLVGSDLALRFGGLDSLVTTGFSPAQQYPVAAREGSGSIPIIQTVLAQRVGDQFKLIYRGRINAWSNSRSLVIVSPAGEGSANPRVRVVLENLPQPKPAGAS